MDLITEIHRAVHVIGMRVNDELQLTQPEALVLYFLAARGTAPLEDVQRAFLHKRSTLTNVLERLEDRGFIARHTTGHDRRRFDIRLTKGGRSPAAAVAALFDEISRSAGAQRDRNAAAELLARIVQSKEAVD